MSTGALAALGLAIVLLVMVLTWVAALRLRNAGIVDVAWSVNLAFLAVLYAAFGTGYAPRRGLIAAMVAIWGLRLGAHLGRRVAAEHPREDGRYQQLRREWGAAADRRLLGFFLAQGLLDSLLSVPFLLASVNPKPRVHILEWAAVGLWSVAVLGETAADRQLAHFKSDAGNRGRTCDVGLWRLSRHPNYFFEWLAWCAYALFAAASPWGWVSVYAPALLLYFLLRVTGIPATEAQALRSRGEAYRLYQQRTSAFVPWFPSGPAA
jgi:steroid 5-alpha reductase family enzyme